YGARAGLLGAADARMAPSCAGSMRTSEPRARLADLRRAPAIRYRTGFCGRAAAGSPAARLRARLLTMERRRGELSRRSGQEIPATDRPLRSVPRHGSGEGPQGRGAVHWVRSRTSSRKETPT